MANQMSSVAPGSVTTTIAAMTTDYTSIRGKTVLVSPTEEQFELLRKRLQERIDDSRGETIFEIGIGEGKKNVTPLADESFLVMY